MFKGVSVMHAVYSFCMLCLGDVCCATTLLPVVQQCMHVSKDACLVDSDACCMTTMHATIQQSQSLVAALCCSIVMTSVEQLAHVHHRHAMKAMRVVARHTTALPLLQAR